MDQLDALDLDAGLEDLLFGGAAAEVDEDVAAASAIAAAAAAAAAPPPPAGAPSATARKGLDAPPRHSASRPSLGAAVPAASVPADGSVSSDSTAGGAKNAAQCKRFRENRKRKMAELRARNLELEAEHALLHERVAELHAEVDMLRHSGQVVDMERENRLLRVEVKRHKAFVERVLDAAALEGDDTLSRVLASPEESYRLLRNGLDAAAGMVKGMLYTSKSWKLAESVAMPGGFRAEVRFEQLGATRLNLRFEVGNLPYPAEVVDRFNYVPYCDPAFMEHSRFGTMRDILPESLGAVSKELGEDLLMHHYKEDDCDSEMVLVTTKRHDTVFPSGLGGDEVFDLETALPCTLCAQCTVPPDVVDAADVVQRTISGDQDPSENGAAADDDETDSRRSENPELVQGRMLLGYVCVATGPSTTRLVILESYPQGDKAFNSLRGFVSPRVANHRLNAAYIADMRTVAQRLLDNIK
ncbi:Uncharacterized protein SCF082_LOCUS29078, partial [Durusdinium trenchii]